MIDRDVVDALAAGRLTRLVTTDTFPPVRILRDRILERFDPGAEIRKRGGELPAVAELVTCNWCAGFWISAGVVTARAVAGRWWDPVAKALAASMVVGLVAGWSQQEGDIKDLTACIGQGVGRLATAIREGAGNGG